MRAQRTARVPRTPRERPYRRALRVCVLALSLLLNAESNDLRKWARVTLSDRTPGGVARLPARLANGGS